MVEEKFTLPKETIKELEFWASILELDICRALSFGCARLFIGEIFRQWPMKEQYFRTNPANIDLTISFNCVVDMAIVNVESHIHEINKKIPGGIPFEIHGKDILRSHRNILGHGLKVEWRNSATQKFQDQGNHYLDPKTLRLWGVLTSWVDGVNSIGGNATSKPVVVVSDSLAKACSIIIFASLKDSSDLEHDHINKKLREFVPAFEKYNRELYEAEKESGNYFFGWKINS